MFFLSFDYNGLHSNQTAKEMAKGPTLD